MDDKAFWTVFSICSPDSTIYGNEVEASACQESGLIAMIDTQCTMLDDWSNTIEYLFRFSRADKWMRLLSNGQDYFSLLFCLYTGIGRRYVNSKTVAFKSSENGEREEIHARSYDSHISRSRRIRKNLEPHLFGDSLHWLQEQTSSLLKLYWSAVMGI